MSAAPAPKGVIGPYLADQARARGHITSDVVQHLLGCNQVAACNHLARHAGEGNFLVRAHKVGRRQFYMVNPTYVPGHDAAQLLELRKQREMVVERIRRVAAAPRPAAEQATRSASAALPGPGRGITPVFSNGPQPTAITPAATSPRGAYIRADGLEALRVPSRAGDRLVPHEAPHTRP